MSKTFIFLVSSHKNISKYQAENSSYLIKMLKQHCHILPIDLSLLLLETKDGDATLPTGLCL